MEAEVATNFGIAATRIHIERFIGRVRDWAINRMDILSSTSKLVNLTSPPVGPKE